MSQGASGTATGARGLRRGVVGKKPQIMAGDIAQGGVGCVGCSYHDLHPPSSLPQAATCLTPPCSASCGALRSTPCAASWTTWCMSPCWMRRSAASRCVGGRSVERVREGVDAGVVGVRMALYADACKPEKDLRFLKTSNLVTSAYISCHA